MKDFSNIFNIQVILIWFLLLESAIFVGNRMLSFALKFQKDCKISLTKNTVYFNSKIYGKKSSTGAGAFEFSPFVDKLHAVLLLKAIKPISTIVSFFARGLSRRKIEKLSFLVFFY